MNIITATPARAAELAQIEACCNPSAWTERQLADALASSVCMVATDTDGTIAAMLLYRRIVDEMEIDLLDTLPDYRRRGLARSLLRALQSEARKLECSRILLEVRADNAVAQSLYRQAGFAVCATRRGYYRNGEDAVVMEFLC